MRLAPVFVKVSKQLPIASSGVAPAPNVAEHVSEPPSIVTGTLPVGRADPRIVAVTLTETVTACPGVDGLGVGAGVSAVVVSFLSALSVHGEN